MTKKRRRKKRKAPKDLADAMGSLADKRSEQSPTRTETRAAPKENIVDHTDPEEPFVLKQAKTGEAWKESPPVVETPKSLPKRERRAGIETPTRAGKSLPIRNVLPPSRKCL